MRPLLLNFVKIHSMVNMLHSMTGQWFPSRHSCSPDQAVWCIHSLGPGNPISLMRFISFPQSHLELPQVKITTRLTGRWNRPFLLFTVWLVFTLVLYCHQLMSKPCPAACTEEDCNDGAYTALCSLSADIHVLSTGLTTSERTAPKLWSHNFTWVFTRCQTEQEIKIIGTQHTFTVIYAKYLNLVFSRRAGCKSRICQEDSCNCVI